MQKSLIVQGGRRMLTAIVLLMVPLLMLYAQEMNEKFSVSTQMFLNGLKTEAVKPATKLCRLPAFKLGDKAKAMNPHCLTASPYMMGSIAYVLLKNCNSLSELHAPVVTSKYDGTDAAFGIIDHGFNF